MAPVALLTDRSPALVMPALAEAGIDAKAEHLSVALVDDVLAFAPELVLVDAAENAGQGYAVLRALRDRDPAFPVAAVVERADLDRFAWEEVADEIVFPGAPAAEIRVRVAMLRRRSGGGDGSTIRLGPMTLDVDTYRVTVAGRPLDLTFKEFEVLRFLASHPGCVFTRPTLLREVWGYDFYGGTRTVDVHVRRLRAKLGPEHEALIETVRGVGYRAADG
ncbi:MAG: winged helix-turn-helix domain-containing protein [Actinomycetota bacterium]